MNNLANIKQKKVYLALDAWRGIACLLVVLCHTYGAIQSKISIPQFDVLRSVVSWGGIGVQLFFVISGYCIINASLSILRKQKSVLDFAYARCRRILPPYWLAIPLYMVLQGVGYFLVSHHYVRSGATQYLNPLGQSLLFYLANFSLTQTLLHQPYFNDIAWTLNYEIAFYFICTILLLITKICCRENAERFNVTISHILTATLLIVSIISPRLLPFPLDLWAQFGLGIVVYDLLQMKPGKNIQFLCYGIMLLAAVVGAREFYDGHLLGLRSSALSWFVAVLFAGVLVIGYRFDEQLQKNKAWQFVGRVGLSSYTIYLLHTVFIVFAAQAVAMAHVPGVLSLFISLTIAGVAVALSMFAYRFIEKPFLGQAGAATSAPKKNTPSVSVAESREVQLGQN